MVDLDELGDPEKPFIKISLFPPRAGVDPLREPGVNLVAATATNTVAAANTAAANAAAANAAALPLCFPFNACFS